MPHEPDSQPADDAGQDRGASGDAAPRRLPFALYLTIAFCEMLVLAVLAVSPLFAVILLSASGLITLMTLPLAVFYIVYASRVRAGVRTALAAPAVGTATGGGELPPASAQVGRKLLTARASGFRLWRQGSLFAAQSLAILSLVGWAGYAVATLNEGSIFVAVLIAAPLMLGLAVLVITPFWAFPRHVVEGEERALATRTGRWQLIRAHRILNLVTLLAFAALSLMLVLVEVVTLFG
ncbi:hypothetical protein GCM10027416_30010 [Okibacterium endophyticum]